MPLSAKEVLADIRGGMAKPELMKKYGLSAEGLESVLRKLIRAGHITQEDIERSLTPTPEKTVEMAYKCPSCGLPQSYAFEECPQCGVFVSKFKDQQEMKERNEQNRRQQEEAERARRVANEQRQEENARRGRLTMSGLKREHASIPLDFKKELYPGLTILVAIGNAVAQWGALLFGVVGIGGLVIAILQKQLLVGAVWLLGWLLIAGLTWIFYKTYSESIQIFLDMSTCLVKNNLLLARILEKDSGQDG